MLILLLIPTFIIIHLLFVKNDANFLPQLKNDLIQLHLNHYTYQSTTPTNPSLISIVKLYKNAYYEGKSLHLFFKRITHHLQQSQTCSLEKNQLLQMMFYRTLAIVILTYLGRFFLPDPGHFSSSMYTLHMLATFLVPIFIFCFHYFLHNFYPRHWFLDKNTFSEQALQWMDMRVEFRIPTSFPLADSWQKLCEHEMLYGYDLSVQKEELLLYWEESQELDYKLKIKIYHDFLPLLEILGFGLPALAILFVPGMALLGE
jgi:hypothetical protein